MIPGGRIELELPCTLTDEEIQQRGRMLGETIWTIDDTQAARTAAMKEFKERLVGLNETQRRLARTIKLRIEQRIVSCVIYFHSPGEGMKRIIRTDTGELVREEEMTAAEKQMNLFASQAEFDAFMKRQSEPDETGDAPSANDSNKEADE